MDQNNIKRELNRDLFDDLSSGDFIFGVGSSAFQVEGAAAEDGKGPSVWDDFTLNKLATRVDPSAAVKCRITDGSNATVAVDMYHRYKEDIKMMKRMGFDVYRFSISWPRLLPGGRASAGINQKGIDYYNDVIDTVHANGMKPVVTLFHWDLPYVLEKEYGGLLNQKKFVDDFLEFAELCFWEFGDRVKFWTTVNEPRTVVVLGYVDGTFPPGKVASPNVDTENHVSLFRSHPLKTTDAHAKALNFLSDPNSDKNPYIAAKSLLVGHATVVHLYRTKFQPFQGGKIGIVVDSNWFIPLNPDSDADIKAAKRGVDFMLGWYLEPVLYGTYPESMRAYATPFTHDEIKLLKGSSDYIGFNYYTAMYAYDDPFPKDPSGFNADQKVGFQSFRVDENGNKVYIGEDCGSTWLFSCPHSFYDHLIYLRDKYPDMPPLYITENGVSQTDDITKTAKDICNDDERVKYHTDHLNMLRDAMKDIPKDPTIPKLNVKGYMIWAWCDNFEWSAGYTQRFGLIYIDYLNNLRRYPKKSAFWFCNFLKSKKKLLKSSNKRQIEDDYSGDVPAEKRLRLEAP